MFLYWIYLNFNRNINYKDIGRFFILGISIPFLLFTALIAGTSKSFLRISAMQGMDQSYWEVLTTNINIFNPDNALIGSLYFDLTKIFHRLSQIEQPLLILNDRYINLPWETFNPMQTFMRIINDLVPGTIFHDVININRLFHHIYFDEFVNFASHTWSIQGTMYLFFGFLGSPIFVFLIALFVARFYVNVSYLAKLSPTFFVFITYIFLNLVEFGVLERILVVDIVRPITSLIAVIFMVKILDFIFLKIRFKNIFLK